MKSRIRSASRTGSVVVHTDYIPSAFSVDEQWYELPYPCVIAIERQLGPEWSNRKIIEHVRADQGAWEFARTHKVVLIVPRGWAFKSMPHETDIVRYSSLELAELAAAGTK